MPRGEYQPQHHEQPPQDRVKQALETLEQGIDAILISDAFAGYLRTMARLHHYSAGNIALIRYQNPAATMVAGYQRWKELGRQVKKGEHGIKILVPHKRRITADQDDDEERIVLSGFGVGTVFSLEQTEGKPLPEPPPVQMINGASDVGMRLYVDLLDFLDERGVPVRREELASANGYWDPLARSIGIGTHIDGDQAVKTLVHETAHMVAGHTIGMENRDVETVAESAAFVVLNRYGIDSSGYTFPYVARWAQDRAVLKRNLEAIQQVSHAIITGLEGGEQAVELPRQRRNREQRGGSQAMESSGEPDRLSEEPPDHREESVSALDALGIDFQPDAFLAGFDEVQLSDEQLSAMERELQRRGINGSFVRRRDG